MCRTPPVYPEACFAPLSDECKESWWSRFTLIIISLRSECTIQTPNVFTLGNINCPKLWNTERFRVTCNTHSSLIIRIIKTFISVRSVYYFSPHVSFLRRPRCIAYTVPDINGNKQVPAAMYCNLHWWSAPRWLSHPTPHTLLSINSNLEHFSTNCEPQHKTLISASPCRNHKNMGWGEGGFTLCTFILFFVKFTIYIFTDLQTTLHEIKF